jgi:hypothetical protein
MQLNTLKTGSTTHQEAVHSGQADVTGHNHAALVLVEKVTASSSTRAGSIFEMAIQGHHEGSTTR